MGSHVDDESKSDFNKQHNSDGRARQVKAVTDESEEEMKGFVLREQRIAYLAR